MEFDQKPEIQIHKNGIPIVLMTKLKNFELLLSI